MLREAGKLLNHSISASDGKLGAIDDIYFDDSTWAIRYFVVRTGLMPFRQPRLLIEPGAVEKPEATSDGLSVWLKRHEARERPAADSVLTTSEQRRIVRRASSRPFWRRDDEPADARLIDEAERLMSADKHLSSLKAAMRWRLRAQDGGGGRIRDFIVDDQSWSICDIEIEPRPLVSRKAVLVLPRWVEKVDWEANRVYLSLMRGSLTHAPRFHRFALVSRLYQMYLYDYYAAEAKDPTSRSGPRRRSSLDAQVLMSSLGE